MILEVIKWTLESSGFSVLTATNFRQALDIFLNRIVDLVVLDYEMPDMTGHEVAMCLRRLNPAVPLILHSGAYDIPEVALKATDAFIPKGVESRLLAAAITELVTKSRAIRIPI
jgi:CheY-like chemotaxis protein